MLDKTDQSIRRDEFLRLAKTISEDPLTRIPKSTHNDLDPQKAKSKNKVFIDVHAHSFTLSHVPANFVKALNFLSTKYKAKILGWLQKSLAKFMGQEDAISILNHLSADYKAVLGQHNLAPKVYIVNLMMDMQRGIGGDLDKSYMDQLLELVDIRSNNAVISGNNYSEQLLPFLAVDPHNPEILGQFLSVFDQTQNHTSSKKLDNITPFVGIKIYTPLGYMPTDPTLMDIFEICEKKNIPVMTHVGGYRTKTEFTNFKVGDREYKADGSFVDTYTPVTIRDKSNIKNLLIQPMLWKRVLDKFPKLKVCFAHMGDKDEWASFRKNPQDFNNHVWQTLDLIKNPKYNAFADISYSFTVKRNVKLVKEWMKDPILSKKLLFGSDFYLTEVEKRKTKQSFEHLVDEINPNTESWKKLSYENTCNYLFKRTTILD